MNLPFSNFLKEKYFSDLKLFAIHKLVIKNQNIYSEIHIKLSHIHLQNIFVKKFNFLLHKFHQYFI